MAVKCGYKENDLCMFRRDNPKKCTGEKDCISCEPVYTGEAYKKMVLRTLKELECRHNIISIIGKGHKSLIREMAISGHCCQFYGDYEGDLYHIFYLAGSIVLLRHYQFKKLCEYERLNTYNAMNQLNLRMNRLMLADYKKVFKQHEQEKYKRALKAFKEQYKKLLKQSK